VSLESTQPDEVPPAASGGEAPAEEAAGAAQVGPARNGGGDTVPTPTPTGGEARLPDALAVGAPGAGGEEVAGGNEAPAGGSGADALAVEASGAGGGEVAGGHDVRVAGGSGADALAADAPAASDREGGTGGAGGAAAADLPPEVARLAGAVADLDDLGELPVPEHVGRYDAVHGQLSEALASIDEV